MKLDKYTDIVIAVVLLCLLYANPPFLHQLAKNPLGKSALLLLVLCITMHNTCLGCLAGLLFILVLHTTREGFEHKEEKKEEKKEEEDEDAKEEGDAVEKKDVADMTPEEIEAEAEKDITSIPEKKSKEMIAVAEQMAGFADRLGAEQNLSAVNSQQSILDLFKKSE